MHLALRYTSLAMHVIGSLCRVVDRSQAWCVVAAVQICHLGNLQSLSLARNALADLPKLLATYLRQLAVLDLSGNAFVRIPPVLTLMPRLQRLDLSSNPKLEVWPCASCASRPDHISAMAVIPSRTRLWPPSLQSPGQWPQLRQAEKRPCSPALRKVQQAGVARQALPLSAGVRLVSACS